MEYKDRDSTEVLAKLLKCKYAIVPPSLKARQERVGEFFTRSRYENVLGKDESYD